MASGAVGLEQVGGVTHAAKGMVSNADTRVSAAKALRSVSEGTHGRNYAPAADVQRAAMDALRLSTRFATRTDVVAVADDMYAAIAQHGSPRGAEPETDALVDELLPGYRKSAA